MRPKPRTASVLSASSMPPHFERSQRPLLQRGVGLRDVARERDDQADRLLGGGDDGRVGRVRDDDPAPGGGVDVDVVDPDPGAADHLQAVGLLDQVGGQLRRRADDDRVVVADRRGEIRVAVDIHVEVLAQELDPRLGDRLPDEDLCGFTRRRARRTRRAPRVDGGAALDVGALLGERELDGGERGRDVEDVVVADVADPEEAVLQVAVPAGDGDPEAVAEGEPELLRVDALGREDPGDDGRAVLVGREELEAHRLRALTTGAAEPDVPVERRFQALLEQEPERDVQRLDERDGGRERARRACPAPRACAPSRSRSAGVVPERFPGGRRDGATPRPGGVISAFCEPEATTSIPHASGSSGTAPRLETASTTTSAPAAFARRRATGGRRRRRWRSRSASGRRPSRRRLARARRARSSARGVSPHS